MELNSKFLFLLPLQVVDVGSHFLAHRVQGCEFLLECVDAESSVAQMQLELVVCLFGFREPQLCGVDLFVDVGELVCGSLGVELSSSHRRNGELGFVHVLC